MFHDNPSVYVCIARTKGMRKAGKTRDEIWEWVEHEYPMNPPLSLMGKELFSFPWRPGKIRKVYTRAIEHVFDGVPVPPQKKVQGGEIKKLESEIALLEGEKNKRELQAKKEALLNELREKKDDETGVVTPIKRTAKRATKKT